MPPMTGVARGFMTSAPVRVLHMIGRRLAMTVATVMTFGLSRSMAPSMTADFKSCKEKDAPSCSRRFFSASSR